MGSELTQEQLEELVEGKPTRASAVFYEKAVLDVLKSQAAGRRIYTTICFLKETQAGVTDWTPIKAKKVHF